MRRKANRPAEGTQSGGGGKRDTFCSIHTTFTTIRSHVQPLPFLLAERNNGTNQADDPAALADWLPLHEYVDQHTAGAECCRPRYVHGGLVTIYATDVVVIQGASFGASNAGALLAVQVQAQDTKGIQRRHHLAVREYWTR